MRAGKNMMGTFNERLLMMAFAVGFFFSICSMNFGGFLRGGHLLDFWHLNLTYVCLSLLLHY